MSVVVSQLLYYPVKSLGAVSTESMTIEKIGPNKDRRMMVVDDNGKFVTQRQCPQMALVGVQDEGDILKLTFGPEQITLPWPDFSQSLQTVSVTVWHDQVAGQLIDHEINAWLSNILNRNVRLVFMHADTNRQVDLDFAKAGDVTGFSDGFPLLLLSKASVEFLQTHSNTELSPLRFRPNILVKGCEPFEEDNWKKIKIGDITFDIVKPCSRCVIPTLNPVNAEKQPEVMKAMLEHRKQGKQVYVGQNMIHLNQGVIEVGQQIEILE